MMKNVKSPLPTKGKSGMVQPMGATKGKPAAGMAPKGMPMKMAKGGMVKGKKGC